MTTNLIESLKKQAEIFRRIHINTLFAEDHTRFEKMNIQFKQVLFDYSKQRITQDVLDQLIALAKEKKLSEWMNKLFSCEHINDTEDRSAMHWALRMPKIEDVTDPYYEVNQLVHQQLDKMTDIVEKIRSGQFRGVTGERITDVVNIGVGGSDLGPLMVCNALASLRENKGVKVHFASTMDGSQISQIIQKLRPTSTLFIISSKSFTTIDTLSNASTAKQWLIRTLGNDQSVLNCHFIGVSTSDEKMTAWGISPNLQLNLWDWVGGRYSLWSAIGLPIAIAFGMTHFNTLLKGAYDLDQHFCTTDWHQNIPILLALIGVWNTNFLGIETHAILPYDGRLEYLTSYLQQLEMESNGKSIRRNDMDVEYRTCPIIWGEVGPNAQHAFYQLLHQGTVTVSSDFIITKHRRYYHQNIAQQNVEYEVLQEQHRLAIANCLAQSRLLAFGSHAVQGSEQLPAYRQYHGNKPSSTILIPQLDPYYLGALIAMYEHKVFVQSVLWDINPFDQWGVEMGKTIAQELLPCLSSGIVDTSLDASTQGLLREFLTKDE